MVMFCSIPSHVVINPFMPDVLRIGQSIVVLIALALLTTVGINGLREIMQLINMTRQPLNAPRNIYLFTTLIFYVVLSTKINNIWKSIMGMTRKEEVILNRLRAGYSLITHDATYNFPPVCSLCNDAELTVNHVLMVYNTLGDVLWPGLS